MASGRCLHAGLLFLITDKSHVFMYLLRTICPLNTNVALTPEPLFIPRNACSLVCSLDQTSPWWHLTSQSCRVCTGILLGPLWSPHQDESCLFILAPSCCAPAVNCSQRPQSPNHILYHPHICLLLQGSNIHFKRLCTNNSKQGRGAFFLPVP